MNENSNFTPNTTEGKNAIKATILKRNDFFENTITMICLNFISEIWCKSTHLINNKKYMFYFF